jgi:hypothetical protein
MLRNPSSDQPEDATLAMDQLPAGIIHQLILWIPINRPEDDDEKQKNPFAVFAEIGEVFPTGTDDEYQDICGHAKPDHLSEINQMFDGGEPTFDMVGALEESGSWLGVRLKKPPPARAECLAELLLLYWGIAARDLNDHALRVARALEQNQLQEARHACAQIVGRDTASLDEPEICRAAIETVAENLPDHPSSAKRCDWPGSPPFPFLLAWSCCELFSPTFSDADPSRKITSFRLFWIVEHPKTVRNGTNAAPFPSLQLPDRNTAIIRPISPHR